MASVQPLHSAFTSAEPPTVMCAACNHRNPAGAKFCNECGLPVHLRECLRCEAINDGGSSVCYKCDSPLSSRTHEMRDSDSAADHPAHRREPAGAEIVTRNDHPALKECLVCEAVNDPSATLCHQCQGALVDITAEPGEHEPEHVPARSSTTHVERTAAARDTAASPSPERIAAEAPLHYVGVLTARADEAELDQLDTVAHHRARLGRRLRWAAAALLVMPSILAATFYAVEHGDIVDRLVDYVRVAIVTPVVRAASTVFDNQQNPESAPVSAPATGSPPTPRNASSTPELPVPNAAAGTQPSSPSDDNDTASPQSSVPASTELASHVLQ